jgi:hypothetical protein
MPISLHLVEIGEKRLSNRRGLIFYLFTRRVKKLPVVISEVCVVISFIQNCLRHQSLKFNVLSNLDHLGAFRPGRPATDQVVCIRQTRTKNIWNDATKWTFHP